MADLATGRMADHWWWRPGWRPGRRMYAWHFTFEDQPPVGELATFYQDRLAHLPGLDPVPPRWLHLTTQDVGFTDEVLDRDLAAILGATRRRLAGLGPARVTIGPAHTVTESVVLRVETTAALAAVRAGLRAAISDVWPYRPLPGSARWWPHISVAYSSTTAPAAPYAAALANCTEATDVRLDAVRLIVLRRDHHTYEWTVRETVELRGT